MVKYTLIEAYNNFAILGLSYSTIHDRYCRHGWNIIDSLTKPVDTFYMIEIKESNNTKYTRDNRAFYFDIK